MNLKENDYEIEIDIDEISGIEEKMLFSGMCDFIIPMSYSNMGNKRIIRYHCDGYISVRDVKKDSLKKVMEILEKTLLSLSKSIEFYILPEKITINQDTVYYNPKTKQVKIVYIPGKNESIEIKIKRFIEDITKDVESIEDVISCILSELKLFDNNLEHMTKFVHEQRRRVLQCLSEGGNM